MLSENQKNLLSNILFTKRINKLDVLKGSNTAVLHSFEFYCQSVKRVCNKQWLEEKAAKPKERKKSNPYFMNKLTINESGNKSF